MNIKIKLGLYLVLALTAGIFGFLAYSTYKKLNESESKAEAAPLDVPALQTKAGNSNGPGYSKVIAYGAVFFVSIVGVGLLIGHDVSQYFGNRVLKSLYNDDGEGISDPEYDAAEQEWANGNHMEAIGLMREYLKKNPREQHVAIRIAEIYEKDLQNNLAAALEYEEVLKHKLASERWGWAAIHLCNLYFKLNHTDKAVALLRRIDSEYGETAAAEKARKRLAQVEGTVSDPAESTEQIVVEETEAQQQASAPPSDSGLPPGFTLKKKG